MPFTAHEVRLAQGDWSRAGGPLSGHSNPRIIAERVDLFSGAIEDVDVGAFFSTPAPMRSTCGRRVPTGSHSIIEMLRVAALSSTRIARFDRGSCCLQRIDPAARVSMSSAVVPHTESLARN